MLLVSCHKAEQLKRLLSQVETHLQQILHKYRGLFLADNHITNFPDLTPLLHLHTLELARNRLISLGDKRVSSDALCCLDLSHNRLTSVTQLQHLPHLRELTVSDNQLTSLQGLEVMPSIKVTSYTSVCQHMV